MSAILSIGARLFAKDELTAKFGKAGDAVAKFQTKLEKGKHQFTENSKSFGTGAIAMASTAYSLGGLIEKYGEVTNAQGEIASLGIGAEGIEKITKAATKFSNSWSGTTTADIIKASYDIKSGVSTLGDSAVAEFTTMAALTAKATRSTTGEMTSLFATGYGIYRSQFDNFGKSTIKGWDQLSAEERDIKFGQYFSAGISGAVQQFKTDGPKMSAYISTLGAAGTSAGHSMQEQMAIGGMLQATMGGGEAATKYRAFINAAGSAGQKLGLRFTDANKKLLSTPEILKKIKSKYGDTIDAMESDSLKKAFGTDEALAMIKLLYGDIGALESNITSMGKSLAGGGEKATLMARAMQTGPGQAMQLMKQRTGNLAAAIGKSLTPAFLVISDVIGSASEKIGAFTEKYPNLSAGIATAVAATMLLTAAVPLIAGGIGMVTSSFGILKAGLIMTKTAMMGLNVTMLANPIGLWIVGITAVIALGVLLYKKFEPIKNLIDSIGAGIAKFGNGVMRFMGIDTGDSAAASSPGKGSIPTGKTVETAKDIKNVNSTAHSSAKVEVDFKNIPPNANVKAKQSGSDVNINRGYAMGDM